MPLSSTTKLIASFVVIAVALVQQQVLAFNANIRPTFSTRSFIVSRLYATVEAPTKEDIGTDQKTNRRRRRRRKNDEDLLGDKNKNKNDAIRRQGPLEYLMDMNESREMDDPFHILLLDTTFEKPKITIPYVAGSLEYVLDMPTDEAEELTEAAFENGFSCLGTWTREECLSLGKQLQIRDIVCRVVPFCVGGQRGWQAKDSESSEKDFSHLQDAGYE